MLDRDRTYLKNHSARLRKEFPGRFLLVHDGAVVGDYPSYGEAYLGATTVRGLRIGEFLIHAVPAAVPRERPPLDAP